MNKGLKIFFITVAVLLVAIMIVPVTSYALIMTSEEKKEVISSLQQVDNNLYTLDYTYDYDINDLMEKGVSCTLEQMFYAGKQTIGLSGSGLMSAPIKGGCSTFNARTPENKIIVGRNFDYYKSPCFLVWTSPKEGYKSVGMVNGNFLLYTDGIRPTGDFSKTQLMLAPYFFMDGMNEKGLSISILELDNTAVHQDSGKVKMTNSGIIRVVLDKASNIEEAIEIFKKYDIQDQLFVSYHYQIVDSTGKSVIIEYINGGEMNLVYPSRISGSQALTNYYVSYDKDHEAQKDCYGWDRMEILDKTLDESLGVLTEKQAMNLLNSVHLDTEMDGALARVVTVWSAVYNLTDLTVSISAGMDYDNIYTYKLFK